MSLAVFAFWRDRRLYLTPMRDTPGGFVLTCPTCGVQRALRPPVFAVTLDALDRPTLNVCIRCPTASCGWGVTISEGAAFDLDPDPLPEKRRSISKAITLVVIEPPRAPDTGADAAERRASVRIALPFPRPVRRTWTLPRGDLELGSRTVPAPELLLRPKPRKKVSIPSKNRA